MNKILLLPLSLTLVAALAACDNRSEAPNVPDPDAGTPPATTEPVETEDTGAVTTQQEFEQRRQEIEQEAQETFDQIVTETQQTGEELNQAGENAMQAISNSLSQAGDTVNEQVDAVIEGVETLRDENMTTEQKLEAVANARSTAEAAATRLGQTPEQAREAGDRAEEAARNALGL